MNKKTKKTIKKRTFKAPKAPAHIKNLIIVESPAKCKTIGKILGSDYYIIASLGHIRDLPKRTMGVDFENNFEPTYEIPTDKKQTVKSLKEHIKNADQVYIATDEDREGEAIGWHVTEAAKLKNNQFKRIAFHEITSAAIKNAVANPRELNYDMVNAQQARRILDRLVGYSLSPLLSRKIFKGLSAGRVQSSTLKIVVDREREIQNFVKEEYWSISALCDVDNTEFNIDFIEKAGKKYKPHDIKNEKQALAIIEGISNDDFNVESIEKKQRKRAAKPPFITSTLQQAASQLLGFSSKKTMTIAQMLYEGVSLGSESAGLITYMRTDSPYIATSAVNDIRSYIKDNVGDKYLPTKAKLYSSKSKNAQEAHECIRPTTVFKNPDSIKQYLTTDQFKLYNLIWRRAVASQMMEALFDQNIVKIAAKDTIWQVIGETKIFDGYLNIYEFDNNSKDVLLPAMSEGDKIPVKSIDPKQHFTEPPPRYTEATLIKALEKNGIGRPSTYAPTIGTITARGYVIIEKKKIIPQEVGFTVTEALEKYFPNIVDTKFTASMETELDQIADGDIEWIKMLDKFFQPFNKTIQDANEKIPNKPLQTTGKKCPKCGSDLVIRKSRYGEFTACSGYPKCKYIEQSKEKQAEQEKLDKENAELAKDLEPCPKCGKKLIIKNSRYGKFVACSGYPKCRFSRHLNEEKIDKKCPKCDSPLVVKMSRRGKFLGCSSYPKCKHIENYKK